MPANSALSNQGTGGGNGGFGATLMRSGIMSTLLGGLGNMVGLNSNDFSADSNLAYQQVASAYSLGAMTGAQALGDGRDTFDGFPADPSGAGGLGVPGQPNAVFQGGAAAGGNYNPYFDTYGPGTSAPTTQRPAAFSNTDGYPGSSNAMGGVALVAIDRTYWPDAPANITYPCPTGYGEGMQIAPGIPCGIALTAVPANMLPTIGCTGVANTQAPPGGLPCGPAVVAKIPITGGAGTGGTASPSGPLIGPATGAAPGGGAGTPPPIAAVPPPILPITGSPAPVAAPPILPPAPAPSPAPARPQWVWVNNEWVWAGTEESGRQVPESGSYQQAPPTTAAAAALPKCAPGYIYSQKLRRCASCVAGTFADAKKHLCVSCGPGYHSPAAAATSCKPCAAGTFSQFRGSTQCTRCAAGKMSAKAASGCVPTAKPAPGNVFGDIFSR
ncbi:hypothetical protein MNEG_2594 [Monoraphidium neglectum]|uniref:Tyrosine-protein kinase ephrin type A/B receptor-like domain-containing protein n=1 Tax=Monoraphidium neglectum TaxID=145388 RepID=A0A0D2NKQ0_9CHLO|nr:hypothetical protein MNEG_2594 [Monoraphidium neglectum]KIZ05361.1 hypothetical protein MNEG_2594 [Monoraphidium neglectum]|eukprot:XP_013904380.1 hypothetical protein MNEG_2594 [Monoraphidium neglectum]